MPGWEPDEDRTAVREEAMRLLGIEMGRAGGLVGIEVHSGVIAEDEGGYSAYVRVEARAEDGSVLVGLLAPHLLRQMAMQFLEAAEASESDVNLFRVLVGKVGMAQSNVAMFVQMMRDERKERPGG